MAGSEFHEMRADRATPIGAHLSRAHAALEELKKLQQRDSRDRQFHIETKWLAANRHRFPGQWIALKGEHLLAVGATAKEVFSKVDSEPEPPLVIRIEGDDLPFAGW